MFPRIQYHLVFFGVLFLGSCLGSEEEAKKKVSGKFRRRAGVASSYAVPMEPLVQYSQRDPLYHKRMQATRHGSQVDPELQRDTNHGLLERIEHNIPSDRYEVGSYYPPSYYTQPEPIIEIIIKESNVTLSTTPPPPPVSTTKEPIHVFYVKYKKNPNPKGKHDQIIYEPPIPALVPHTSEIQDKGDSYHQPDKTVNYSLPLSTTTLRTIIRPESETYHGSGIKVTFGHPGEAELELGSELNPRVVSPPDSQHSASSLVPNYQPGSHSFSQPQQYRIRQGPPTQIFNSQTPQHLKPPHSPSSQVPASSFQSSKYAPPTDEQIRQYQQEKLFLYQESLKQQNLHSPPIAPVISPQQFQNPKNKSPSQLQINFNQQRQSQQQPIHAHGAPNIQSNKQLDQFTKPLHQKQSQSAYYSDFQHEYHNQNQNIYPDPQSWLHDTKIKPDTGHQNEFNSNYENNPHPLYYRPVNGPASILGPNSGIKQDSIQPGISVFEQTIVTKESPKDKMLMKTPSPNPVLNFNSQKSDNYYYNKYKDGEIIKSVTQSEEHQVTPDYRDAFFSSLRDPPKRNKLPQSDDPLQFYPVYSTTQPPTEIPSSHRVSSIVQPNRLTSPFKPETTTEKINYIKIKKTTNDKQTIETTTIKVNNTAIKTNIAALPDELPADLRAQLLSSGILSNADIQILDYDKIGDIPIESLPPEALENFYSAGSDPVPSVVKPESEKNPKSDSLYTEKHQKLMKSYLKKYGSQVENKSLKDTKYNRYLPLKVNGSEFSESDASQLKERSIKSVVVLAPVDYDLVREKDVGEERAGKAIQVEGVRFIAGEALKDLVNNPTRENYRRWLNQERNTPSRFQSVILLITRKEERGGQSNAEIFMYDVNSSTLSKLRGELSQTFVEVAEANSANQDLEGIDST